MRARIPGVRVGSSSQLFQEDEPACDACGEQLPARHPKDADADDDPFAPFALRGEGALLWWRDGHYREEKRPLCPACAAAIGVTALTRWAIEEEEG